MERVIVLRTKPLSLQVCAAEDATDAEIKYAAEKEIPCGTTNGWQVIRDDRSQPTRMPVPCGENKGRIHYILDC